jgi:hypothetical protein
MLYNFKKVWNFFENLGYARAVAHLARQGFYKETEALVFDMKEKANIKLKRIEESTWHCNYNRSDSYKRFGYI